MPQPAAAPQPAIAPQPVASSPAAAPTPAAAPQPIVAPQPIATSPFVITPTPITPALPVVAPQLVASPSTLAQDPAPPHASPMTREPAAPALTAPAPLTLLTSASASHAGELAENDAGAAAGRVQGRQRPEAPGFSFTPPTPPAVPWTPGGSSPPPATEPAESLIPATVALRVMCPTCDAENPPGYRFCVTCGASLKTARAEGRVPAAPSTQLGAVLPPALPQAAAAPQPLVSQLATPRPAAPQIDATLRVDRGHERAREESVARAAAEPAGRAAFAVGGAGSDKIVGAPVVDIAAARQPPTRLVACSRCHGHCPAGTRYCKYCGAPLEGERHDPVTLGGPVGAGTLTEKSTSPADAREAAPSSEETSTLPSSAETAGSPKQAQVGAPPLRSPHAVRPASAWAEARASRAPDGRLVVIIEDGSEGKSFPLSGRQIDIGRTEGDIHLEDDLYVAPRHARLIPHDGGWIFRDLGSVNRSYLRIRQPYSLRDADLLLLGLEVLQFQTVSDGERGLGHAIQHGTLLFGSPAVHRRARLCQRTVEGVVRDVYHLHRDETVIGRETGDIVFTSDPFLSRRHAVVRRNPVTGEFTLTDLDSSNGTYVAVREDVPLANGDFVRIGQHLFRVDLS